MAKRRKYSEEFKREAVGLIRQPGRERERGGTRYRRRSESAVQVATQVRGRG